MPSPAHDLATPADPPIRTAAHTPSTAIAAQTTVIGRSFSPIQRAAGTMIATGVSAPMMATFAIEV